MLPCLAETAYPEPTCLGMASSNGGHYVARTGAAKVGNHGRHFRLEKCNHLAAKVVTAATFSAPPRRPSINLAGLATDRRPAEPSRVINEAAGGWGSSAAIR